jgi:hypothetical protein
MKRSAPKFDVDWLKLGGVFIVKVTNQVISTYAGWKVWWKEEQKN